MLASPTEGEGSSVVVDVNRSTAAAALGFGLAPPSAPNAEESEPAAFEDEAGGVWLFWSSRGDTDGLKIWYNRFDGQKWGTPRALTSGATADREPFVLFGEAEARLWVFWTGRKGDGRKNIFWRTTTNLDFATQTAGDWAEHELSVEQGYAAARLTALAILGSLQRAIGDLDRVAGWRRVFGMVNSAPGFNRQPLVINGFSDLILELYGPEIGAHARSAVGLAELPFDIPVEIEGEVELVG